MKWNLLMVILSSHFVVQGQITFSKIYDFDTIDIKNSMIDMEISDSSIYILSNHFCTENTIFTSCSMISKFDFEGNKIRYITTDSITFLESISVRTQSCDDCLTIQNDTIIVSANHSNDGLKSTFLYKFDKYLNNFSFNSYPVSNSTSSIINEGNIIIDSTIFIYGNVINGSNIPDSVQIIFSGLNGTVNWTKYISIGDGYMNINSLQQTPDSNIAIILSHPPPLGSSDFSPKQTIKKLNANGDTLASFSWLYDQEQQNRLLVSEEGDYYFFTDNHPITGFDGISYGRLNKLDGQLQNLEWSMRIPNHAILDGRHYRTEDIIQAQNGDIIGCGTTWENSDSETLGGDKQSTWNGFMIRVTQEGEIVWLRIYRNENDILPTNIYGRFRPSYLTKVRELEDGRLLAAGVVSLNGLQYGGIDISETEANHIWLLIVDQNGCLENYPCQELIRLDSVQQVDSPPFTLGTKWTYEFFPETNNSNEIIHSYISFELIEIVNNNGINEYIIENNRSLPTLRMRQTENETWFYNNENEVWSLTYDFDAFHSYHTNIDQNSVSTVSIDTIVDLPLWFGDRGFQQLQHISLITDENDTIARKQILNTCGFIFGGLTFEDHSKIGEIRCFEQDTFQHNFGPLFPFIECDTTWTEIINSVYDDGDIGMVKIYPNPTLENIIVSGLKEDVEFAVYTLEGKKTQNGYTKNGNINLSQSGFYILNLFINDKILSFKIVKLL